MDHTLRIAFSCLLSAWLNRGQAAPPAGAVTDPAPVDCREESGRIVLGNGLAEFEFDRNRGYDLIACRAGRGAPDIPFASACFVYCEAGTWKQECKPQQPAGPSPDDFADFRCELRNDGGARTLQVTGHNDRLRVTKTFTLGVGEPGLRVGYRIETTARHQIEWGYTSLFRLPRSPDRWVLPENRVEAGLVVRRFGLGPPLQARTIGNQEFYPMTPDAVGVYCQPDDSGVLFVNDPGCTLCFRSGERRGQQQAFVGVRFEAGQFSADGVLASSIVVIPFRGEALAVADQAMARYRQGAADLEVPVEEPSGRRLATPAAVPVWWDLPTSKVLLDEPVPAESAAAVEVSAARGEFEPFQIVLRPAATVPAVRLECSALHAGGVELPATAVGWNPVGYSTCEHSLSATDIVGELPDTLQPPQPVDCPAGRNQPFWVTVRVPEQAVPGDYTGEVRLLTTDLVLATVPIRLKVRRFGLPQQRSVAAFLDPWRHCVEKHYGKERTAALWPSFCQHLAEHRAGPLHPTVPGPTVRWDDQGQVAGADFAAFDAALDQHLRDYRQPVVVLGCFTVGWGHIPRDTRFGKADEVLSPAWTARCRSYAVALRDHLREKGWSAKVVFSLFDEPKADYYPMLADVVRLLREVAPEWRFTYWGNYAPQLDGVFGVWTVPMDDYRPALGARLRARGDQVWVYNPPGYRISSGALAARAVYWWLWTEHIPGVYQWTISAWIEWTGDTRLWDPYRNASWVVPGPDAPLDTIRFELAREGLEDYEYLVLLETLARQAEARGLADAAAAARKLLDDSRGIAWSPADGRAAILHTRSPRELHTQRERLAEGIETLAEALGHGR